MIQRFIHSFLLLNLSFFIAYFWHEIFLNSGNSHVKKYFLFLGVLVTEYVFAVECSVLYNLTMYSLQKCCNYENLLSNITKHYHRLIHRGKIHTAYTITLHVVIKNHSALTIIHTAHTIVIYVTFLSVEFL